MAPPRWKGKGAAKALADPMSSIVSQLQSSLVKSNSLGLLSGSSVLLEADAEQTDLLNRSCFGKPVISAQKNSQWFQFSLEEAFYLCYSLKCINVVDENKSELSVEELWKYMISTRENFPSLCKAYSHLRSKNWVVRSGSQYGVDFVAYRHHPALVHAEYAVLVLSSEGGDGNDRLRVWSDYHCTLRLCGSVAKTLLVLHVEKHNLDAESPSCLDNYIIEERTITRWSPEQCREDKVVST
ncbi:PREDICTED: tRNA-splicing endonuclease subunit Sen2-1-like [Ipomoea nil]|uniref:tRNA-splicing endonuclease subunit Sen2-1-like n=1 Tax=Ipomoea nil TaxID=35883 RepID=UPI000900D59A|nr:PREDICTED: tRNA-splicing endonuclease subunit Sen2-1-like [Ipomoea nil]XP_019199305.1 PREDICTED: tRNA-splicing endonuclease subunit Sen2-1-like [Ipomoea nil]XP_019199306.1 PREDICTED: tRNA-splicing endonuclease subunit Sen2-1-like [Ipomoea nil]XP_019199307.1 PREDICTED: tRNA-splicing endonuclease subunit Sen2-1-like [Ipomoea nil]